MIWVAMITGSMPVSGRAPCAPLPVMWMSNRPPPAICGPERMANLPTSSFGRLCMPKICSQGNFSNSPSLTIASAPPRPSSAGWKMKWTVPSKLRVADRYLAAPSSMVVWPSWPQACMRPLCWLRWSKVLCSSIGSASMSARSPIGARIVADADGADDAGLADAGRDLAAPFLELLGHDRAVRSSSKPSSGWAWMSRRMAVSSADEGGDLGLDIHGLQDSNRKDVITRRNSAPCTFGYAWPPSVRRYRCTPRDIKFVFRNFRYPC